MPRIGPRPWCAVCAWPPVGVGFGAESALDFLSFAKAAGEPSMKSSPGRCWTSPKGARFGFSLKFVAAVPETARDDTDHLLVRPDFPLCLPCFRAPAASARGLFLRGDLSAAALCRTACALGPARPGRDCTQARLDLPAGGLARATRWRRTRHASGAPVQPAAAAAPAGGVRRGRHGEPLPVRDGASPGLAPPAVRATMCRRWHGSPRNSHPCAIRSPAR